MRPGTHLLRVHSFFPYPHFSRLILEKQEGNKDSAIKLYWHYAITDVPHERMPRERIEGNDRLTTNQLTAYILLENSTTDFKFEARLLDEMKSTIWPWVGFKPAWILPNFFGGSGEDYFLRMSSCKKERENNLESFHKLRSAIDVLILKTWIYLIKNRYFHRNIS